jgi:hypothetical protein
MSERSIRVGIRVAKILGGTADAVHSAAVGVNTSRKGFMTGFKAEMNRRKVRPALAAPSHGGLPDLGSTQS